MIQYDLVKVFKALADKTRQDIIELLCEKELNVTDICSEFNISQPTVSHHLQILRNCDLIISRKEGKMTFYSVRKKVMNEVFSIVIRKMHIDYES
jgi:DNA-binding transcriptional ArsR family regulator